MHLQLNVYFDIAIRGQGHVNVFFIQCNFLNASLYTENVYHSKFYIYLRLTFLLKVMTFLEDVLYIQKNWLIIGLFLNTRLFRLHKNFFKFLHLLSKQFVDTK